MPPPADADDSAAPMRRPLLAVALVSMLAACDGRDARAPFTDSRPPASLAPRFWTPPGWAWGLIETSGRPAVRYGVDRKSVV